MTTNRAGITASRLITILSLAGFIFVFVRTAWLCDDAFITLRVVDNLVNGYGLVWNADERVQAFTHPLWLLLLTPFYAVTREPYYTTLVVSGLLSIATVALLLSAARNASIIAFTAVMLIGSKAFADFSSSGLENPLTHLLVVAFSLSYISAHLDERSSSRFSLFACASAGLLMLNRLDLTIIILPAVSVCLAREHRWNHRLLMLLAALGPLAIWLLFAAFYYGFPLPNTYYAKLASSIPRTEYLVRGLAYATDLLINDALTTSVIAVGLIFAFLGKDRRITWPLGLGILAYGGYILWIGGDFMRGRFFSAMFVMSVVCMIWSLRKLSPPDFVAVAAFLLSLGLSLLARPVPNWMSTYPYPKAAPQLAADNPVIQIISTLLNRPDFSVLYSHVFDERGFYYAETGLLPQIIGNGGLEKSSLVQDAQNLRQLKTRLIAVDHGVGLLGFYAGPQLKIIDRYALADALLARLPYTDGDVTAWRIGHIKRSLPDGYVASRLYGQNLIRDPQIRSLYADLSLAIREPLLLTSWERLRTIAQLNLNPPEIDPAAMRRPARDLTRLQFSQSLAPVPEDGLTIFMDGARQSLPQAILLVTDPHTSYVLEMGNDWSDYFQTRSISLPAPAPESLSGNVAVHFVELTTQAHVQYNLMRLTPLNPSSGSSAGYFRFIDESSPRRSSALIQSGVVLSTATPLRPPPAMGVFAGVWWSEASITHEVDLALTLTGCTDSGDRRVFVRVNRQVVATVALTQHICERGWQSKIGLGTDLIRKRWNLLEVYAEQPTRIKIDKVHPKALPNP